MDAADGLAELSQELRGLPRRQRRAVLDSLTADEQAKLTALLAGAGGASDPRPRIEGEPDLFSACLKARLGDGVDPEQDGSAARWKMTPSARLVLRQSARTLIERQAASPGPGDARRSLAGAVADLLLGRRRR